MSYLLVLAGVVAALSLVAASSLVAACVLAGRRDQEALLRAPEPAPSASPAGDPLLERALRAIDGFRDAMHAYKELAEQLQGRLDAQRDELEDWKTAATYHAESVRRQQAEIAELQAQALRWQQENETLRALYVRRTQEALAAGLSRVLHN